LLEREVEKKNLRHHHYDVEAKAGQKKAYEHGMAWHGMAYSLVGKSSI